MYTMYMYTVCIHILNKEYFSLNRVFLHLLQLTFTLAKSCHALYTLPEDKRKNYRFKGEL